MEPETSLKEDSTGTDHVFFMEIKLNEHTVNISKL
jgi:hypothetical protein